MSDRPMVSIHHLYFVGGFKLSGDLIKNNNNEGSECEVSLARCTGPPLFQSHLLALQRYIAGGVLVERLTAIGGRFYRTSLSGGLSFLRAWDRDGIHAMPAGETVDGR